MPEDFNKLHLMASKLVRTPFQQSWQFRVEIDGYSPDPLDLDIYVKDISYGPIEIETEAIKAGMHTLTYPTGTAPVGISMTVRDNQDERIYKWLVDWSKIMINVDGTVNLPPEYLMTWKRYTINAESSETLRDTWKVFLTQVGDITESKEDPGFLEFPISLIQFKS